MCNEIDQELTKDILMCFVEGGYNAERILLSFAQMVDHLIMTEDLAIDRENERIYWTATGETLGCGDVDE